MLEIRQLLERYATGRYTDHGLAWGARLSDYRALIEAVTDAGQTAVAIELSDDLPKRWRARKRLLSLDHHGERAGADQPSALQQVFDVLQLKRNAWTRRLALVAANDIGHVAGLREAGARRAEILTIRAEDRRVQGVTVGDEAEAVRALSQRQVNGGLTVIKTTSTTSSAIADFVLPEFGGPGYAALLVIMPAKLAFYGPGGVVLALSQAVAGSWSGGALPQSGYWGANVAGPVRRDAVIAQVAATVAALG